jgi:hypothetical protein
MAGSTGTPRSAVNPCRSRSCTAIWVGRHPRGALRRTSRHGDGWHPVGAIAASPLPSHEMHLDLETLKRLTEAGGRDFSVLTISYKAISASRRRTAPIGLAPPTGKSTAESIEPAKVRRGGHPTRGGLTTVRAAVMVGSGAQPRSAGADLVRLSELPMPTRQA